jgi:NAD(P)H-hydrate epimerase
MTPHAGEYARLCGQDVAAVWPQRFEALPARARDWRAFVVAKGPGTVVATPGGQRWVNPTGGPALATGGTGDVLTGMLAALVAEHPHAEAVAAGVWLHGLAGEEAARRSHTRSVTALDVAAAVPAALRRCEEEA